MRIFSDTLSANQERYFFPSWANRGFENDEGLIAGSFSLLILGLYPITFLFDFGPGFTHGHIHKQSLESQRPWKDGSNRVLRMLTVDLRAQLVEEVQCNRMVMGLNPVN